MFSQTFRFLALFCAVLLFLAPPMRAQDAPANVPTTVPPTASPNVYARQYAAFALKKCDDVEKDLPHIIEVAETVAKRHIAGGKIVFPWNGQSIQQELSGRAGGMMMAGQTWTGREEAGNAFNIAITGWDRAPRGDELKKLRGLKAGGTFIIGFGPKEMPELAPELELCDAFFDTGLGADDRVVTLPDGQKVGRGNVLANMLNGWAFTGELIAALTRQGKMPTIWRAWLYPDGREWSSKYYGHQFHDDFTVAPIAAGVTTRDYLAEMRAEIPRFESSQPAAIAKTVGLIIDELKAGRKTIVATQGHTPWTFVARTEDARWATLRDVDAEASAQLENYRKNTPDGALVLRLGYSGLSATEAAVFAEKKQKLMLVASPSPLPDHQIPPDLPVVLDAIWTYGDAVIPVEGYPQKILPPSGVMQVLAYESLNAEILAHLPKEPLPIEP